MGCARADPSVYFPLRNGLSHCNTWGTVSSASVKKVDTFGGWLSLVSKN